MKETVVSFEIAKKLQEKGYDWQTFDWYSPFGDFSVGMFPRTLQGCPMRRECYAPTIGLALKWLREEKKIHVMLDIWKVDPDDTIYKWGYDLVDLTTTHVVASDTQCADSYEQAGVAGIEYCLDHII